MSDVVLLVDVVYRSTPKATTSRMTNCANVIMLSEFKCIN